MIDLTSLFDSYSRHARLYPSLLTLLPALSILVALSPRLLSSGQALLAIVVACGGLFLLADLARTLGKRVEPRLLQEWGGWPTTIWLRHRDDHLPAGTKARYHSFLSQQSSVGRLPTSDEESNDPKLADDAYAASVMWLKERCRGSAFPLLERENATYGFRRNLLGLKPVGVLVSVMTMLVPMAIASLKQGDESLPLFRVAMDAYVDLPLSVLGAVLLSFLALVFWLSIVSPSWVREAGDQYARALLANCDSL